MSALLGQIGSLLTTSPGNLIYQLVLAFSIAGALQAAWLRWRTGAATSDGRAVLGLGAMLATLAVFFAIGAAAASLLPAARGMLPPLDRAVTFILLTCAIWIWAFPEPGKQPDLAALILTCLAIAGGGLTLLAGGGGAAAG